MGCKFVISLIPNFFIDFRSYLFPQLFCYTRDTTWSKSSDLAVDISLSTERIETWPIASPMAILRPSLLHLNAFNGLTSSKIYLRATGASRSLLMFQMSTYPSASQLAKMDGCVGDHYTSYMYSWLDWNEKSGAFLVFGCQSLTVQSNEEERRSSDISECFSDWDRPGCTWTAVTGALCPRKAL